MANTPDAPDTEQTWQAATSLSSAHLLTANEDEKKRYLELSKSGGSYAVFTQVDPAQLQSLKDIANSNPFQHTVRLNI